MSNFTRRLSLQQPVGTDAPSAIRIADTANTNALDGSVITTSGTLSARPAASSVPVGNEYYATDVGQWARSDGTNWHTYLAAGDLKHSAAATAPNGWLLCDGSAVSRTTYAALFAAISTAYGTGDGSTTFNLPDYRGRTILGAGTGAGLTARSLGQKGGEEAHLSTAAESGTNGNGVTQAVFANFNGATVLTPAGGFSNFTPSGQGAIGILTQFQLPAIPLTARNADSAHNNMQPFAVGNVLIKT